MPKQSAGEGRTFSNGAEIYVASVAKPAGDVDRAIARLSAIACEYRMTVMMSNCVGVCDGWQAAGKTSVWNKQGVLLSQLNDDDEGIIVVDTVMQDVIQQYC